MDLALKPQILQGANQVHIINPYRGLITNGLVGWWRLDDGAGTSTVRESSGNGHTGALVNVDSNDWVTPGLGGYAAGLNVETDEYANIPGPASAGFTAATITALVKFDSVAGTQTIYYEATSDSGYTRIGLYLSSSKLLCLWRDAAVDPTGSSKSFAGATTLTTGTTYHVAFVFNSNADQHYAYIDGSQDASNTTASGALGTSTASRRRILCASGAAGAVSNPLFGTANDIRIYNRALSANEIASIASGQG